MDSSCDKLSYPTVHFANVMFTVPMNSSLPSEMPSHEFNSECISECDDESSTSSDQSFWMVMNLNEPSGNNPKVPGSRPGRAYQEPLRAENRIPRYVAHEFLSEALFAARFASSRPSV